MNTNLKTNPNTDNVTNHRARADRSDRVERHTTGRGLTKVVAVLLAVLTCFGALAASVPAASAAERVRAVGPPGAPGVRSTASESSPNDLTDDIVAAIKGHIASALLEWTQNAIGLGPEKSHVAEDLAEIKTKIDNLRAGLEGAQAKAALDSKIDNARDHIAAVDKLLDKLYDIAADGTLRFEQRAIVNDPKKSDAERAKAADEVARLDGQVKNRIQQFEDQYAASPANRAVEYFNTILSPVMMSEGVIGQYRTAIMKDPTVEFLSPTTTANIRSALGYFEAYQGLSFLLVAADNSFRNIDSTRDAERFAGLLVQQEKLLPTPIPNGTVIQKNMAKTDQRHNLTMWAIGGTCVTFDVRHWQEKDQHSDDGYGAFARANQTKLGGQSDWKLPWNADIQNFGASSTKSENFHMFLTEIGFDPATVGRDLGAWTNNMETFQPRIDSHFENFSSHVQYRLSDHTWRDRGASPSFSRDQGYTGEQINKAYNDARNTLMLMRDSGTVDYI